MTVKRYRPSYHVFDVVVSNDLVRRDILIGCDSDVDGVGQSVLRLNFIQLGEANIPEEGPSLGQTCRSGPPLLIRTIFVAINYNRLVVESSGDLFFEFLV